jgi:regulator of cell morphogenesis and NO signaling
MGVPQLGCVSESRPSWDTGDDARWLRASMGELVDHIVGTHHAYLRRRLPQLQALVQSIPEIPGAVCRDLPRLIPIFQELQQRLESHLAAEEELLFPMLKRLESMRVLPACRAGMIGSRIRVVKIDHRGTAALRQRIRDLTAGFTPPDDACATYRALLGALAELEADMAEHLRKEHEILFPRAVALEQDLAQATSGAS